MIPLSSYTNPLELGFNTQRRQFGGLGTELPVQLVVDQDERRDPLVVRMSIEEAVQLLDELHRAIDAAVGTA